MLTPYRPQFIEKILTDSFGRRFRVVFTVSLIGGEVRGRVVSAQLIDERLELRSGKKDRQTILCLPCASSTNHSSASIFYSPYLFVSPYFSLEFLINSQPTRAPSSA